MTAPYFASLQFCPLSSPSDFLNEKLTLVYTSRIGVTVAVYTSIGCSSALRIEMSLGLDQCANVQGRLTWAG